MGRNRTALSGFADHYLTTRSPSHIHSGHLLAQSHPSFSSMRSHTLSYILSNHLRWSSERAYSISHAQKDNSSRSSATLIARRSFIYSVISFLSIRLRKAVLSFRFVSKKIKVFLGWAVVLLPHRPLTDRLQKSNFSRTVMTHSLNNYIIPKYENLSRLFLHPRWFFCNLWHVYHE